MAFPQKSPAKRRRRPRPGASQRGACLPQRFHSPDRKIVSDGSHQDCTPRHSLCPLLEPKPHVRTLKVKGRGEVSLDLFSCSLSLCFPALLLCSGGPLKTGVEPGVGLWGLQGCGAQALTPNCAGNSAMFYHVLPCFTPLSQRASLRFTNPASVGSQRAS